MIVRAMQPLDLHRIRIDQAALPGWRDQGATMLAAGPCWAAVQDGEVLALAGLVVHWPGRAGCWCLIGTHFPRRGWVWLHKQVVRRMGEAQQQLQLHRIEAESAYGWLPGARWLERLGFEREGLMRAYGHDGRDFIRWARIASAAEGTT